MSVRTLAAVADLSDLPPTCKLVLYGLAIDAGGARVVTSYPTLMRNTGLSERGIRGALRVLENKGLIDRQAQAPLAYELALR